MPAAAPQAALLASPGKVTSDSRPGTSDSRPVVWDSRPVVWDSRKRGGPATGVAGPPW
jgi:hypothetical protein